jgi:hypothetical protein
MMHTSSQEKKFVVGDFMTSERGLRTGNGLTNDVKGLFVYEMYVFVVYKMGKRGLRISFNHRSLQLQELKEKLLNL